MHYFELNEPVVKALAAQLAAQLPGAVDTVNADVTDGYTILYPVQVHDHVPLLTTLAGVGFPAVAIEDMGTRFEDDIVSSVTGVHRVAVLVFLANPDPEALAWQLRRYQQAVMLAVQADRTLGGESNAWTTRLRGIEPGPFLEPSREPNQQGANDQYLSWFACELEMPRAEV
jgi:hypothetical protein